jgi:uncharacterized protein YjbJ (UPF0337 family)
MGGKTDIVKGRVKEAVGAITNDEQLREEGRTDQAVGKVKEVAADAIDSVKEAAESLKKAVKKAVD